MAEADTEYLPTPGVTVGAASNTSGSVALYAAYCGADTGRLLMLYAPVTRSAPAYLTVTVGPLANVCLAAT